MSWFEDWLDFWFPPQQAEGQASKVLRQEPAPLPKPPEFYLRHIPCEPCPSAVEEAQRVLKR